MCTSGESMLDTWHKRSSDARWASSAIYHAFHCSDYGVLGRNVDSLALHVCLGDWNIATSDSDASYPGPSRHRPSTNLSDTAACFLMRDT